MPVLLRKPLQRVVRAEIDRASPKEYTVTLYPDGTIGVRAKRSRTEYCVPLAMVFYKGAEAMANTKRRNRRKRTVSRGLLATERGQT